MDAARSRAAGRARNPLNQTILSDFVGWAASAPDKLDTLYSSPHAAQCVLRALSPVARLYVARTLYLPASAPAFEPAQFRDALCRRTRARDRHEGALTTLRALRVFVPAPDAGDGGGGAAARVMLTLHPEFAHQLRRSVTGSLAPVFDGPVAGAGARREVAELDMFSATRLERVLNFSIGGDGEDGGDDDGGGGGGGGARTAASLPSQILQASLARTRILAPCDGGMQITSTGFQFLLKDSCSQIWILLRDVINSNYAGGELEALNFVFQLSFAQAGCAYSLDELTDIQRSLAPCLDELGVIIVDEARGLFSPTSLGIGLVASASRSEDESSRSSRQVVSSSKTTGDIQVIVETNFRLYAYVL